MCLQCTRSILHFNAAIGAVCNLEHTNHCFQEEVTMEEPLSSEEPEPESEESEVGEGQLLCQLSSFCFHVEAVYG